MSDHKDAFIILKRTKDLLAAAANKNYEVDKNAAFINNAPFRSCISKIVNILVDNTEDLYIIMWICILLEHNPNYWMTSRSLWIYYKDEIDDVGNDNASDGKSFQYTKISKKNAKTFTTTWKSRRRKTTSITTIAIDKRWSHVSTQVSKEFLNISWSNLW